jgi:hypothetical protein
MGSIDARELSSATLNSPLMTIIGNQNRNGIVSLVLLFRVAITRAARLRCDRIL